MLIVSVSIFAAVVVVVTIVVVVVVVVVERTLTNTSVLYFKRILKLRRKTWQTWRGLQTVEFCVCGTPYFM